MGLKQGEAGQGLLFVQNVGRLHFNSQSAELPWPCFSKTRKRQLANTSRLQVLPSCSLEAEAAHPTRYRLQTATTRLSFQIVQTKNR